MDGDQQHVAYHAVRRVFGRPLAEACLADPTFARLARTLDRGGPPGCGLRNIRVELGPGTAGSLHAEIRNPAGWLAARL